MRIVDCPINKKNPRRLPWTRNSNNQKTQILRKKRQGSNKKIIQTILQAKPLLQKSPALTGKKS
jgi:hypothetical protein